MPDQLSVLYSEFLEGGYDCVDRVVCMRIPGQGEQRSGLKPNRIPG
jgi:hypothetical protein